MKVRKTKRQIQKSQRQTAPKNGAVCSMNNNNQLKDRFILLPLKSLN